MYKDWDRTTYIPVPQVNNTNINIVYTQPYTGGCAIEKYFEDNKNNPHAGLCNMVCNCGKCQKTIC